MFAVKLLKLIIVAEGHCSRITHANADLAMN